MWMRACAICKTVLFKCHLAVALWQIRINVTVFVCALNCEE